MDQAHFIALLKEKSPKGINEIYESYAPVMYLFILQVTNNDKASEELLIKAFLMIWNDSVIPITLTDPLLYLLHKVSVTLLEETRKKTETETRIKKYLKQMLNQRSILNSIIPGPSHNLPQEPEPISITAA